MKEQGKKGKRDPVLIQFAKLAETVSKMEAKNISKIGQIKKLDTFFDFKLYKPSIPNWQSRQQLGTGIEIMLRQIDKLMDDQEKLNIQMDRHQIKVQEYEKKMEKQIMLSMDHFTFLRKLWAKDETLASAEEKVDRLIHNIGATKGHILNLIKKQSKNNQSSEEIHQLIISSQEYCELNKNYQELKSLVNQQQTLSANCHSESSIEGQELRKYNEQLEEEVARLKIELANRQIQLERVKATRARTRLSGSKIGTVYNVSSLDGTYNILIEQIEKKEGGGPELQTKDHQQRCLISKQSLQNVLKFLETGEPKKSVKNLEPIQQDHQKRRFTGEDFAKVKFISNLNVQKGKVQDNAIGI